MTRDQEERQMEEGKEKFAATRAAASGSQMAGSEVCVCQKVSRKKSLCRWRRKSIGISERS